MYVIFMYFVYVHGIVLLVIGLYARLLCSPSPRIYIYITSDDLPSCY